MVDWEEVIKAECEDDLKEIKLFLFRENMRLENDRREMLELQDKFIQERVQFRNEMDTLNHKMSIERKRLKDDTIFFDKKMQILQDGFRQLDIDRRRFDKDRARFELEKEWFLESEQEETTDIAKVLFKGTTNLLTIRKRYKDLMKIFHPDNLCGDSEIVQLINNEYDRRKAE